MNVERKTVHGDSVTKVQSDGRDLIAPYPHPRGVLCAKLIHHAGIQRVLVVDGGYAGENGVGYLQQHGVEVMPVEGPKDPRL